MKEEDRLILLLRQARRTDDEMIARFMTESNAIEGEPGLNPNDLVAAKTFIGGPLTEKRLLACHGSLAEPRKVD